MANYDVDLELLLGKPVVDPTDTPVGVIEEIRAEKQGGEWVMQAYLIDSITMLERLSIWTSSLEILHLMGVHEIHGGYIIPWEKLDLTDPEKPRLLCALNELQKY
ncbi:hypothetical protein [Fischerella thermalis]|uniref:PRC-barrel domain-containing protein n=1 Tax=Fischerella thermalis CCMEE 5318 TaxID=2019666 RepID=A0A2N6LFP1_9CYAN|nr:hypothetical protein [Fischerella thermalis]PMB22484.1 hypothetical protein CEN46_12220 [Fischerella thermalis CCMEE 5318]